MKQHKKITIFIVFIISCFVFHSCFIWYSDTEPAKLRFIQNQLQERYEREFELIKVRTSNEFLYRCEGTDLYFNVTYKRGEMLNPFGGSVPFTSVRYINLDLVELVEGTDRFLILEKGVDPNDLDRFIEEQKLSINHHSVGNYFLTFL